MGPHQSHHPPSPCSPVNRLCGSGFQSIVNGCQEILVGDAQVVLTGGTDNMSAAPYAVRDIRWVQATSHLSPLLAPLGH